jgi:hypothetical protein
MSLVPLASLLLAASHLGPPAMGALQNGAPARPTTPRFQDLKTVEVTPLPSPALLNGVLKQANAAGAQSWVKLETLRLLGAQAQNSQALSLVKAHEVGAIDFEGVESRLRQEAPALARQLDASDARVVAVKLETRAADEPIPTAFLASWNRAPMEVVQMVGGAALLTLPPEVEQAGRFQFRRDGQELRTVGEFHGVPVERGRPVWILDTERKAAPLTATADGSAPLCHVLINGGTSVAGQTADVRLFAVWAAFSQSPLVWSAADTAYATDVRLGLRLVAGASTSPLGGVELPILLSTRGAHANVAPAQLLVTPSDASFAQARFRVERHVDAKVELLTWLGGEALAHPVELRPSADSLELRATTTSTDGLGLGRVSFTVERFAEDRQPLALHPELRVELSAHRDVRGLAELIIPAGASRSAAFELRTDGLGQRHFEARAGALRSEPLSIQFRFPWLFLALCLVGGALGGWVKLGASRKKEDRPSRRALVGAGVGLLVVLLRVSGVWKPDNLPDGVADYGVGAFALSALAGFIGRGALSALVARFGWFVEKAAKSADGKARVDDKDSKAS